jgi:hypothetical protein
MWLKMQTLSESAVGARFLGHYMPLPTGYLFKVREGGTHYDVLFEALKFSDCRANF